jgi:hypothetical protein
MLVAGVVGFLVGGTIGADVLCEPDPSNFTSCWEEGFAGSFVGVIVGMVLVGWVWHLAASRRRD